MPSTVRGLHYRTRLFHTARCNLGSQRKRAAHIVGPRRRRRQWTSLAVLGFATRHECKHGWGSDACMPIAEAIALPDILAWSFRQDQTQNLASSSWTCSSQTIPFRDAGHDGRSISATPAHSADRSAVCPLCCVALMYIARRHSHAVRHSTACSINRPSTRSHPLADWIQHELCRRDSYNHIPFGQTSPIQPWSPLSIPRQGPTISDLQPS